MSGSLDTIDACGDAALACSDNKIVGNNVAISQPMGLILMLPPLRMTGCRGLRITGWERRH